MKSKPYKKAFILSGVLMLFCTFSLLWILFYPNNEKAYTAYIHVNGTLYKSIPLAEVETPYEFSIQTSDGHFNKVYVETGSIRISSADCPDLICVRQGAITNSLLPITCLPHKLVITLKPTDSGTDAPDAISH